MKIGPIKVILIPLGENGGCWTKLEKKNMRVPAIAIFLDVPIQLCDIPWNMWRINPTQTRINIHHRMNISVWDSKTRICQDPLPGPNRKNRFQISRVALRDLSMHMLQYHPWYPTHQNSKPSLTMRTASNKPLTGPAPPVSRVRTRTGVGRGNKPT